MIHSGTIIDDVTKSIYAFCKKILGYDLHSFFGRNSSNIKSETEKIVEILLEVDSLK